MEFFYNTDLRFDITCDTIDFAAIWHWIHGKPYKTRLFSF